MNEIREIKEALYHAVFDVVVKSGVIDIYPNGPDRDKAVTDLEIAKSKLLVAIGSYDTRRYDIIEDWKKDPVGANPEEFIITSHEVIEFAYRYMMKYNVIMR